jgi:hypothetical protein
MNMLPPGRPGVSSCSISAFAAGHPRDERNEVDGRRMPERNDHGLARRRLVERRDDLLDAPQVLGVIGDDERVGPRKGRDRVVGRNQRSQHVDHLLRRLVAQRHHLRDQAVPAAADRTARDLRTVHLGLGFQHQLGDAVAFDGGDPLQAQRRQQCRVDEAPRHRARGNDVHRSLDARIDDEVATGDLRHRLDDGFDVGIDEIERDRVVLRRSRQQREGSQEEACGEPESEAAKRLQQGEGRSLYRSPERGFGIHRRRWHGNARRMRNDRGDDSMGHPGDPTGFRHRR